MYKYEHQVSCEIDKTASNMHPTDAQADQQIMVDTLHHNARQGFVVTP